MALRTNRPARKQVLNAAYCVITYCKIRSPTYL